jgi:hypothetical protein
MGPQHSEPITFDSGLVALALRALHQPRSRYPFLERLIRRRRKGRVRLGGVVVGRTTARGRHFVVVRRGEKELFTTLQREFRDVPEVQVIWDRRSRDRRAKRVETPKAERRQRERRGRSPATWEIQGYLLMRSE